MHEGLWSQLVQLDPAETARRAGCQYFGLEEIPEGEESLMDLDRVGGEIPRGYWILTFLNREYVVDPVRKTIRDDEKDPAGVLEQLCMLGYMIQAQDISLSAKLVKAEHLPGGAFFFRGIHELPTGQLAEALGKEPETLIEAGKALGGRHCEYGDASVEINILPRLPITIILWAGDEQFDSRASILFDQTAAHHIALDALQAGVNLTVKALLKFVKHV